jgi:hypothetical protein
VVSKEWKGTYWLCGYILGGLNYCNSSNTQYKKVSDILDHYYLGGGIQTLQNKKFSIFANNLGLNFNSPFQQFINLDEKLVEFNDQVNDSAAMYLGGAIKNAGILNTPIGCYPVIKLSLNNYSESLLHYFFKAIGSEISKGY